MQARNLDAARSTGRLIFDRYRLIERLGFGGTAEVWHARDERLLRDVAIKLLHRHLLPDERSRLRFLAEARAVAGLSHAGIVGIHDVLVDEDQAALVLELVDGEPVSNRIASKGPLPAVAAAGIAAQVAGALEAAHASGLVHRDIKPGNVLLSPDGRARIVDFGIALATADEGAPLTAPGSVMGTLRYMAPEQLSGQPATSATDVFGLGSLLYEMLAGRPPFAGPTPAALLEGQRDGSPPIAGADSDLAGLAQRALATDPQSRPHSAGDVEEQLQRWLAAHDVAPAAIPAAVAASIAAPSPLTVLPPPAPLDTAAQTVVAEGVAPIPSERRRIPIGPALLGAGLLLIALVGAALGGFGGPSQNAAIVDATASPKPTARPTSSPTPGPVASAAPVRVDVDTKPPKEKPDDPKKKNKKGP